MRRFNFLLLVIGMLNVSYAQETKNVLFLGNSYTNANNLPNLVAQIAQSVGDTFTYDANTPGGHTLEGHSQNATSLNKIRRGDWDFVVLQEQSQRPSFPEAQVISQVYPYAQRLTDSINKYNACARITFYMTWGRENGDTDNCPAFPPLCTYQGMDDLLRQRYQTMADDNNGIAAPVGAVWRYLRTNHPSLDLYAGDGSHPSLVGSYAGAVTFYTTFYRKDPTLITFNSSLSNADATIIKNAVKTVVFDDFTEWNIGSYDVSAAFTYANTGNTFEFTNLSEFAENYEWDFGDGNTSNEENPIHTYEQFGNFTVTLTAGKCEDQAMSTEMIQHTLNSDQNELSGWYIPSIVKDEVKIYNTNHTLFSGEIKIYNMLGKNLYFNNINFNTFIYSLNIENLERGLYFIKLSRNGKVYLHSKFIKH